MDRVIQRLDAERAILSQILSKFTGTRPLIQPDSAPESFGRNASLKVKRRLCDSTQGADCVDAADAADTADTADNPCDFLGF